MRVFSTVEFIELPLNTLGVFQAMLHLVQLKGPLPALAGVVVVAESDVNLSEPVQGSGFRIGVAEVAVPYEGLLVAVQGLVVLVGAVGQVAQAVQRSCLAHEMTVAAT